MKVCLVHVQSARNKTSDIADLTQELDADIAFLTESWLYPSGDEVYLHELTPTGYSASSFPRLRGRGGGICVLFKQGLNFSSQRISNYSTFECCESTLTQHGRITTFVCLYRPPPNRKNKLTTKDFIKDFQDLLDSFSLRQMKPIFLGDFNIHYDNSSDTDVRVVKSIIDSDNLHQVVDKPTHKKQHTLDWILTDNLESVTRVAVEDKCFF